MTQFQQSRKKRQLILLINKLRSNLKAGVDQSSASFNQLIKKIRLLVQELSLVLSKDSMRKIIGSCAAVLGMAISNQAEAQNFAAPVQNPFGLEGVVSTYVSVPHFADLDGDGDFDLFVGGLDEVTYEFTLYYSENTGDANAPAFAPVKNNPFGWDLSGYILPFIEFADMDGDGDLDLSLMGYNASYEYVMYYFENAGDQQNPSFAAPVENPFGLDKYISEDFDVPVYGDLDLDGDYDMMRQSYDSFNYYENTGDSMEADFAAPQKNPFGLVPQNYMTISELIDIDLDGDLDIITGTYYNNGSFLFFENTGSPQEASFEAAQVNPFGLVSTDYLSVPAFADLDGDGDADLLVADYDGNFQYFENISNPSSTEDPVYDYGILISPNPSSDQIRVKSLNPIDEINILDMHGRIIGQYTDPGDEIDIQFLEKGTYLLKVLYKDGTLITRTFIKL